MPDPEFHNQAQAEMKNILPSEIRMMGYVAAHTAAPENIIDGQIGSSYYKILQTSDMPLQANRIEISFRDEEDEQGDVTRHSLIIAKLVFSKSTFYRDMPRLYSPTGGEELYKLHHLYDAKANKGNFWFSCGLLEMEPLSKDNLLPERIVNGFEVMEIHGLLKLIKE
jgi:hypothetical protein